MTCPPQRSPEKMLPTLAEELDDLSIYDLAVVDCLLCNVPVPTYNSGAAKLTADPARVSPYQTTPFLPNTLQYACSTYMDPDVRAIEKEGSYVSDDGSPVACQVCFRFPHV